MQWPIKGKRRAWYPPQGSPALFVVAIPPKMESLEREEYLYLLVLRQTRLLQEASPEDRHRLDNAYLSLGERPAGNMTEEQEARWLLLESGLVTRELRRALEEVEWPVDLSAVPAEEAQESLAILEDLTPWGLAEHLLDLAGR